MVSFHMLKLLLLLSVIVDVVIAVVIVAGFDVFIIIKFVAVDRLHLF